MELIRTDRLGPLENLLLSLLRLDEQSKPANKYPTRNEPTLPPTPLLPNRTMPPRWGHHHRHHHHGPPLGAMMVGAALGAGVMAASRPPPPRTVYVQQPQTTTVVYANNGGYGGATQTTYVQAPPLQAYNQQQVREVCGIDM